MENVYQRMIDGDKDALKEILEEYGKRLIFFINGFVKNTDIAEDLMEDTFCALIISQKKFENKSSFKTYLFAIAKNKAVDYIKKNKRNHTMPLEEAENCAADMLDLEQAVIDSEEKRQLHIQMDKLKDDYKQVLYLIYFEDLSYEQAGKIMGKRVSQVKNLAYRARQALKVKLENRE